VTVRPLYQFPLIRDLVVDMAPIRDTMTAMRAAFVPAPAPASLARVAGDGRERRRIDRAIECIGCGMCVSACTLVARDPAFPGPAALNRVFTGVDIWILFKIFIIMPVTGLFFWWQVRLLQGEDQPVRLVMVFLRQKSFVPRLVETIDEQAVPRLRVRVIPGHHQPVDSGHPIDGHAVRPGGDRSIQSRSARKRLHRSLCRE
jgi:ferredoxin